MTVCQSVTVPWAPGCNEAIGEFASQPSGDPNHGIHIHVSNLVISSKAAPMQNNASPSSGPGRRQGAGLAGIRAAQGLSNAQIAADMFISERTVKAHLSDASNLLGLDRIQMARLVERAELGDDMNRLLG